MRKIILTLGTLIFSISNITATLKADMHSCYQTDKTQEKVDKMDKIVGFTGDQKAKYKALVEKSEKDKLQLKEKMKGKSSDEQKKLKTEFKANYEKNLKAILTSAQWSKLEAAKQKAKDDN